MRQDRAVHGYTLVLVRWQQTRMDMEQLHIARSGVVMTWGSEPSLRQPWHSHDEAGSPIG